MSHSLDQNWKGRQRMGEFPTNRTLHWQHVNRQPMTDSVFNQMRRWKMITAKWYVAMEKSDTNVHRFKILFNYFLKASVWTGGGRCDDWKEEAHRSVWKMRHLFVWKGVQVVSRQVYFWSGNVVSIADLPKNGWKRSHWTWIHPLEEGETRQVDDSKSRSDKRKSLTFMNNIGKVFLKGIFSVRKTTWWSFEVFCSNKPFKIAV